MAFVVVCPKIITANGTGIYAVREFVVQLLQPCSNSKIELIG
jgi:hypothetical protein